MLKRKRDDADVDDDERQTSKSPSPPPLGAGQQRVQFKLQQGQTKLGQAFKLAKGFERQKLGRRSKNALVENRNSDAKRLAEEIAALKGLDTGVCARHLLQKTLGRIKAVAESDRMPPGWTGLPAGSLLASGEAAGLNVFGRLCNANPVKTAMPAVLAEVQGALGLVLVETEEGGKKKKKKRVRAKDYAEAEAAAVAAAAEPESSGRTVKGGLQDKSKNGSESEDEFEGFDDRLASSENEDEENHGFDSDGSDGSDLDEDMNVSDLERQLENEGYSRRPSSKSQSGYNHNDALSLSPTPSTSRSPTPEPSRTRPRAAPEPAPRKSAFLPSLTMGGYLSGSDGSDIEEVDVAPPRKNRRGQRARQQIWEKKYGKQAKHVVNPKANPNPTGGKRADGWDMKRGATDGRRGGGNFRGGRSEGVRGGRAGVEQQKPPQKKHKDDTGPIHPSWEAAKKAKAAREAPVAFQGKKITFD